MKPTNLVSQKYKILVIAKLLKYQSKLVSNVESKEMASLRISKLFKLVQWTPLNGITDNGINRLMGSNLAHLTSPK